MSVQPFTFTSIGGPRTDYKRAFDGAKEAVKRIRQAMNSNRVKRKGEEAENVQYIAAIRNSRSRYGKKRRKNLRNAWHEIEREKSTTLSRFQTFKTNGFADGLGPIPCVVGRPGVGSVTLPFFAFRLTSFPQGQQSVSTQTPNFSGSVDITPTVGYQLVRSSSATASPVYSWLPLRPEYITNENPGKKNTYDIYMQEGDKQDKLRGFRHEWSDIRMTLYPQQGLPTDWTVRLVKWKDDIPTYPPSAGFQSDGSLRNVYTHTNAVDGQRAAVVTMMWDNYFGAKILHPNNTNPCDKTAYGKLPFVPLRTEKFYLPSREQTTAQAPTRLLHRMFFRNDRHYNTKSQTAIRRANLNTLGTFNYIDENQAGNTVDVSPFVTPGEEIWLIIEATGYKSLTVADPPSAPGVPTFDLVIRNKHSSTEQDSYDGPTVQPPSSAAQVTEETEKELINETENEPPTAEVQL